MIAIEHLQYVVMTILPVFLVIGLGYLASKNRIIPENGYKAFAAFVFNFGLPAAIFSALSTKPLEEVWNVAYVMVYTVGSLLAFTFVAVLCIFALKKTVTESIVLGLGSSFSNSLLIGFPVIYFLFGTSALVPFSLTLVVENLIMLPLLLALADMSNSNKSTRFLKKLSDTGRSLLKNPIVLSILLGMLVSGLNINTPEMAERMVEMLANTVTGVALFTIGGGLVGVRVNGMKKEIGTVVFGKLVIHPLLLLVMIVLWFDLDPTMSAVAVILASMPMFGVYAVIGQRYNMGGLCSAVLLPTTIIAMATVSVVTTSVITIFSLY
ncbi:AEC family transporter [Vibrio mediterranei]|uniref:AEC family transporter n=1 Tax=Vibrio mediterranei TaxID=689 RepID=UPI001EFE9643|nr:AEC family transporter [Vibrio mediterranei]MCG9662804.1 AEC family transporter [Vibrio mediterranei]